MFNKSLSENYLLTIILVLLAIITFVMIYNYWTIYTYASKPVLNGTGSTECYASIKSMYSDTPRTLQPVVNRAVVDAAKYLEGDMSPKLKQHTQDYIEKINKDIASKSDIAQTSDTYNASYKPIFNPKSALKRTPGSNHATELNHAPEPKHAPEPNHVPTHVPDPDPNILKNDKPEKDITKFVIYHMNGCGHCHDIMQVKNSNGKTTFENLCDVYANDDSVHILDLLYGKDNVPGEITGFPTIRLITENGRKEYYGKRDAQAMSEYITNNK
jgi:hypothetical protein